MFVDAFSDGLPEKTMNLNMPDVGELRGIDRGLGAKVKLESPICVVDGPLHFDSSLGAVSLSWSFRWGRWDEWGSSRPNCVSNLPGALETR